MKSYSRRPLLATLTVMALSIAASGLSKQISDWTPDEIVAKLGSKTAEMTIGGKQISVHEKGRIVYDNGVPTAIMPLATAGMPSDADLAAKRLEIGMKKKEAALYDPDLLNRSPNAQLQFWSEFRQTFPEIDVSAELDNAKKRLLEQDPPSSNAQEVAELENRERSIFDENDDSIHFPSYHRSYYKAHRRYSHTYRDSHDGRRSERDRRKSEDKIQERSDDTRFEDEDDRSPMVAPMRTGVAPMRTFKSL